MTVELKPVEEQVIVITGASSGIGLSTARMAADRGARLVLVARSGDALEELVEEIVSQGGDAVAVPADVRDREAVREIVEVAEETYGGFDTWINGAATFIYGRLEDTPIEDMRAQFDTNVWGLLLCSLAAANHLRDRGGALINIGSIASDRAMPLQGSYSASKHAVKAFTDTLRMELEEAGAPVSVTLVKPSAIDTPYPDHAKNHMDAAPTLPPPIYEPETVARTILHAAEHPERDVVVGGGGKAITTLEHYASGLLDSIMERQFFEFQRTDRGTEVADQSGLEEPTGDLEERGPYDGHVSGSSIYTRAALHRARVAALGLGAAAAAFVGYGWYRASHRDTPEKS